MKYEIIQIARQRLQKRFLRLPEGDFRVFHGRLIVFWNFINSSRLFYSLLVELENTSSDIVERVNRLFNLERPRGDLETFRSEREQLEFSYQLIKQCVHYEYDPRYWDSQKESMIGGYFSPGKENDPKIRAFWNIFVRPIYEFLDEQLDDKNILLYLIERYKHLAEWFRATQLREAYLKEKESGSHRGEKILAYDVYEFLFSQGLDFHIAPSSATGEIDMISEPVGKNRLMVEVKVFDAEKRVILNGFNQIYTYTLEYNQPVGCLLIFNLSVHDICFSGDLSENPFVGVSIHDKTIFIAVIDIATRPSASKRGKLEPLVFTREDLVSFTDTTQGTIP
jgi:hypothetical protein